MEIIKNYNLFLEGSKKFPNIKELKYGGCLIMVGRDAKSNDHLTFNIADSYDMWFHVKGYPGSHVILKCEDINDDLIKLAAETAKKHSKAKNIENIKVVYCERTFVSKDDNMNDGKVKVDYKNKKEIEI